MLSENEVDSNGLLSLLENVFFCYSYVKWENILLTFSQLRYGSVLTPFICGIYLHDLSETCSLDRARFVIVYADNVLLISTVVVDLQ